MEEEGRWQWTGGRGVGDVLDEEGEEEEDDDDGGDVDDAGDVLDDDGDVGNDDEDVDDDGNVMTMEMRMKRNGDNVEEKEHGSGPCVGE